MRALRDEYAKQMKEQFDKKISEIKFKVGDLVWMRNEDRKNKLDKQRVGPFKIKHAIGDVTVELEDVPGAVAKTWKAQESAEREEHRALRGQGDHQGQRVHRQGRDGASDTKAELANSW